MTPTTVSTVTTEVVPEVEFRDVFKTFEQGRSRIEAVREISFAVPPRQFVAVVGPSGCGKSTLLSMSAGILFPNSGQVRLQGKLVKGVSRDIGYLFQRDTLLPWKTVLDSVALPLRFRGVPRTEAEDRAHVWLRKVGLSGFEKQYPYQLSGGMRKRVALAAVFVYGPSLLLMDEPFSALDVQTRNLMENQLLELWQEDKRTVLFVTHDLEEAIGLADRVIVMTAHPGRIKRDSAVTLKRPRNINDIRFEPEFVEQYRAIWQDLRSEVLTAYERDARGKV